MPVGFGIWRIVEKDFLIRKLLKKNEWPQKLPSQRSNDFVNERWLLYQAAIHKGLENISSRDWTTGADHPSQSLSELVKIRAGWRGALLFISNNFAPEIC